MHQRNQKLRAGWIWRLSALVMIVGVGAVFAACGSGTSSGSTSSAKPIKIGLLAEQTGALASYGAAHVKVAEAAVKQINANGGIAGRQVQLIVADTQSDSGQGVLMMRKLIQTDHVDFVVGSNTDAVVLACAPIAQQLKTFYFSTAGGALGVQAGTGNRWVCDLNTNVEQNSLAGARFGVDNIGKKWAITVDDYAWGWSSQQYFTKSLEADGGTVLDSVRVPIGTANWQTYLQGKVPADTNGIFFANFGTDFLSFIRDLQLVNPTVQKLGANYVLSGQDISKLGAAANGTYVITGDPMYESELNSAYDKAYRQAVGMDAYGNDVATGKPLVAAYQWSTWESIYAIKEGIEATGWKSKADTPKFITWLEGRTLPASDAFPEGTITIRAADHLAMHAIYMEQVKDGKLVLAATIPAAETTYPAVVNYPTQEPLQ